MEVRIRKPENFHSLTLIPVQFPLDYIKHPKALFISEGHHVIISTSFHGKHNRLSAGEVKKVMEGKAKIFREMQRMSIH